MVARFGEKGDRLLARPGEKSWMLEGERCIAGDRLSRGAGKGRQQGRATTGHRRAAQIVRRYRQNSKE